MIMALLFSCVIVSSPVLAGMAVVARSGVKLSESRNNPLDDNLPYVRWDESHAHAAVVAINRWLREGPVAGAYFPATDPAEHRELLAVWEVPEA
jgi:hypothetical protein